MSFTNDRFQIFVNKTPLANNSSNTSILTQPQNNTHVKTFTLSTGGLFQGNLLENPLNTATLSSENLHGTTNSFNDYQGNVYVKDNYGAYDNELVQTPTYPDDCDENHYSSGLSNASKKIRKDMLSSNARTWGNKKAMQEELKMKTKRNPWQPEEDEQVLDLVAKYGQSWALIASLMKERSGKQIRDRYLNKLRPDINKGEWTEREDEILISFCTKIGHKWSRIATHLPGRTEGQVKNRFYSHIKKRLPKWHTAGIPEQSEEDELYQDEAEFDHKRHTVKQEAMGFGMNNGAHVNKKILCLNSGNVQTNTGFGSFNIKVNTLGQTMDGAKFLVNRADPTDVISYGGLANMHVKTHYTTADDAKSPYQLSSTRASSLSQDKDFEENYGKMSKMWTEGAQANKGKMISFSLLNGNIVPTQKPAMTQQVNKLDFSSGQGKISLNIF